MGLRDRLKKLERETRGERYELVCPECGEAFTLYGDAPVEYLVWEWARGQAEPGETHRETPADMLRAFEHGHDPGAFVEKHSGLPFLSREVSGINLGGPIAGIEDGDRGGA